MKIVRILIDINSWLNNTAVVKSHIDRLND